MTFSDTESETKNSKTRKKSILLIITGSIACYKSLELIRQLRKKSYDVHCVLTDSAQKFISKLLVSSLSANLVHDDLFSEEGEMTHIRLPSESDLILIAPATADFISRINIGRANDLASSAVLASDRQIILAPAMNGKMWQSDVTQKNLQFLNSCGAIILEPERDILACGDDTIGKMIKVESIVDEVDEYFSISDSLRGKKILLTGGGTQEKIDPVRIIGNRSSGKQAISIAKKLNYSGADVVFISANIERMIPLPSPKIVRVQTADEMLGEVMTRLHWADVFIGCAAVSDYKVENYHDLKIKKSEADEMMLRLVRNVDILESVLSCKARPKAVIGFAADDGDLIKNGMIKLKRKGCDLVVSNAIKNGDIFGSDETEAAFISKDRSVLLEKMSKDQLAAKLVRWISELLQ